MSPKAAKHIIQSKSKVLNSSTYQHYSSQLPLSRRTVERRKASNSDKHTVFKRVTRMTNPDLNKPVIGSSPLFLNSPDLRSAARLILFLHKSPRHAKNVNRGFPSDQFRFCFESICFDQQFSFRLGNSGGFRQQGRIWRWKLGPGLIPAYEGSV
jgi:hypothetical protein